METIKNLWFDGNRIYMRSSEGRVLSRPLEAYPELEEATTEQRNNYTIEDEGRAIRWEELDADMHISSFYETTEPDEQNEVAAMFRRCPWLNVSEVARAIGINKSLLARYIRYLKAERATNLANPSGFPPIRPRTSDCLNRVIVPGKVAESTEETDRDLR